MSFDVEDLIRFVIFFIFILGPLLKRVAKVMQRMSGSAQRPTTVREPESDSPAPPETVSGEALPSWLYDRAERSEEPPAELARERDAELEEFHTWREEAGALEAYHTGASLETSEEEGEDLESEGDAPAAEESASQFVSYESATLEEETVIDAGDEAERALREESATREQVQAALAALEARLEGRASSGTRPRSAALAYAARQEGTQVHGMTPQALHLAGFVRDAMVLQILLEPHPKNPFVARRAMR